MAHAKRNKEQIRAKKEGRTLIKKRGKRRSRRWWHRIYLPGQLGGHRQRR